MIRCRRRRAIIIITFAKWQDFNYTEKIQYYVEKSYFITYINKCIILHILYYNNKLENGMKR